MCIYFPKLSFCSLWCTMHVIVRVHVLEIYTVLLYVYYAHLCIGPCMDIACCYHVQQRLQVHVQVHVHVLNCNVHIFPSTKLLMVECSTRFCTCRTYKLWSFRGFM